MNKFKNTFHDITWHKKKLSFENTPHVVKTHHRQKNVLKTIFSPLVRENYAKLVIPRWFDNIKHRERFGENVFHTLKSCEY